MLTGWAPEVSLVRGARGAKGEGKLATMILAFTFQPVLQICDCFATVIISTPNGSISYKGTLSSKMFLAMYGRASKSRRPPAAIRSRNFL